MISDNLAIDIRQLQQFLTILECGSLGRAARRLNISEPALSKSIKRMEGRLQVPLLDRSRRGVAPTAYGRALAVRAEFLTSEWRSTLGELGELRGSTGGISRAGTTSSYAGSEIVRATGRLHEMLPGVRAMVRQDHSSELIQAVLDGALDFAIVTYDGELFEPDIVKERVGDNPVVVTARVSHPLARKNALSAADIAREPWIVPRRDDVFRNRLETLFTRHNLDKPVVLAESSGILFTLSYLRAHDALAYMPHRVILSAGGQRDFAILPVKGFDWRPQTLIVRRRGSTLSPAVRTHIKLLKEAVVELTGALKQA